MRTPFTLADLKKSPVAAINQHLFVETATKKPKRSKYNNVKIEFDGYLFDSQKECDRYISLRMLKVAGEIMDLRLQVEFVLETEDEKICSYIADFVYTIVKTNQVVVEDVKSPATRRLAPYRMKKRMMLIKYEIDIKEV